MFLRRETSTFFRSNACVVLNKILAFYSRCFSDINRTTPTFLTYLKKDSFLFMLIDRRELLWELIKNKLRVKSGTLFNGILWSSICSIGGIVSWVILHKTNIIQPGDTGVPYWCYVLIGSQLWGVFLTTFHAVIGSVPSVKNYSRYHPVPFELVLTAQAVSCCIISVSSFFIHILILRCLFVSLHLNPFLILLTLIPIITIACSIGLFSLICDCIIPQYNYFFTFFVRILFFCTPIIYPHAAITDIKHQTYMTTIIQCNPFTYLIGGCRDLILGQTLHNYQGYCISCFGVGIGILVLWRIVQRLKSELFE